MAASVARKSIAPSPGIMLPVGRAWLRCLRNDNAACAEPSGEPNSADPGRRNKHVRCRSSKPNQGELIRSMNRRYCSNRSMSSSRLRARSTVRSRAVRPLRRKASARRKRSARRRPTIGPTRAARPASVCKFRAPISLASASARLVCSAADGPIVRIGFNPRRVPIRLARIGHGVHHKAVDVGDLQAVLFKAPGESRLCARAVVRPARRGARRPTLPGPSSRSRQSARSSPRSRSSCTRWN